MSAVVRRDAGWRLAVCLVLGLAGACGDKETDETSGDDGAPGTIASVVDTGASDTVGEDGSGGSGGGGDGGDGGDGSQTTVEATVYPADPTTADTLQCLLDGALAVAAGLPVRWSVDGTEQTELADGDIGANTSKPPLALDRLAMDLAGAQILRDTARRYRDQGRKLGLAHAVRHGFHGG